MKEILDISAKALSLAKEKGASEADVIMIDSSETSYSQRLGKVESVERSSSRDIGIRVFIDTKDGYKSSVISTNDLSNDNISEVVEKVIFSAKLSPADKNVRLAEKEEYLKSHNTESLKIYDDSGASIEELKGWAEECESSALEEKGISNSDGADASHSESKVAIISSKGFEGNFQSSSYSFSTSVIAEKNGEMETDYDYSYARNRSDLDNPKAIGKSAAKRTIEKLNPRKVKTTKAPIIYDKRVAKSLLGNLLSGINGNAIVKKSSFLGDSLNKQTFPKNINIIDNPQIVKGLSSQPFDCEGLESKKLDIVKDGVLQNWILDLRTASKLGLESNGRASRGVSSQPYPSSCNVYLENGEISFEEMIKDVKNGLYLTESFGMGVNNVTGDYSQGASGFWIENGEIAYPVSEITIAGNLLDMFKNLTAANDLEMKFSKNSPTLRIDGMTIAGE